MANQVSRTGMHDVNSEVALLDKAIDVVFMRRDQAPGMVMGSMFDKVTKDSGLTHIIQSAGRSLPLPRQNEDTEALPYVKNVTGFAKTFVLINYRAGVRVTDTIMRADRFDRVAQMVTGQLTSGLRKDEYMRAAIFNAAFSGTAGADALALCHDTHPQENADAGTWDNLGTGALSGPNLHALRLLARKMTNDLGYPDPVEPRKLLVPPDLEQKAIELTKPGQGKPETSFNEVNALLPSFMPVVSNFLSSTTAYYLIGDRTGHDMGLTEVALLDWNIKNNTPANADIVLDKRIKAIKAFGFTTSRNIFGSAGT